MSISDYYRPAEYQIRTVYRCDTCRSEGEYMTDQLVERCHCGGRMQAIGESYPASHHDWDEERDRDGHWRHRS
mgnify:CR=1 FL=1